MDRLVSKTDGNGNETSYIYEGANITSVTDANGNTSKIYYNELNQITGLENANGEIKEQLMIKRKQNIRTIPRRFNKYIFL